MDELYNFFFLYWTQQCGLAVYRLNLGDNIEEVLMYRFNLGVGMQEFHPSFPNTEDSKQNESFIRHIVALLNKKVPNGVLG